MAGDLQPYARQPNAGLARMPQPAVPNRRLPSSERAIQAKAARDRAQMQARTETTVYAATLVANIQPYCRRLFAEVAITGAMEIDAIEHPRARAMVERHDDLTMDTLNAALGGMQYTLASKFDEILDEPYPQMPERRSRWRR